MTSRWKEADAQYEKALSLRPNNPQLHYFHGVVLEKLGKRKVGRWWKINPCLAAAGFCGEPWFSKQNSPLPASHTSTFVSNHVITQKFLSFLSPESRREIYKDNKINTFRPNTVLLAWEDALVAAFEEKGKKWNRKSNQKGEEIVCRSFVFQVMFF